MRCYVQDQMYLMLCRYQSNPGHSHWQIVKNIPKYLKRTKNVFLVYERHELQVYSYSNASFESNINDSKSQSRYVFTLNGGVVSWKTSKQEAITYSTTEVEYIFASKTTKKNVLIKKFITKLSVVLNIIDLIALYFDNNKVITQAKEPRSHQRF